MDGMIKAIFLSSIMWNGENDFNRIKRQRALYQLSFFMARGGATTATTYIRPYKQAVGLSAVQTMEERFAYGLNVSAKY